MSFYKVSWTIEIDAENPVDAARRVLAIHRNPNSTAQYFEVVSFGENGKPEKTMSVDLFTNCCYDENGNEYVIKEEV